MILEKTCASNFHFWQNSVWRNVKFVSQAVVYHKNEVIVLGVYLKSKQYSGNSFANQVTACAAATQNSAVVRLPVKVSPRQRSVGVWSSSIQLTGLNIAQAIS